MPSSQAGDLAESFQALRRERRRHGTASAIPRSEALIAALVLGCQAASAHAADLTPPKPVATLPSWTGFYIGSHLGYALANSNYATPGARGTVDLEQTLNTYDESGSFLAGINAGYSYQLPNRLVVGVEADASFPAFPNLKGFGIGGASNLASPIYGAETYTDEVLTFGTLRARVGYAPHDWLYYVTGGFAWSRDQLSLTQFSSGAVDFPFIWRTGWVAGAGIEAPLLPHWSARLEYLFTDYAGTSATFATIGQRVDSGLTESEVRVALNYHFDDDAARLATTPDTAPVAFASADDRINIHGQGTFTLQGYPGFASPFQGPNSLPGTGQARETTDATVYAGLRLWKGAEFWIDPEVDEGFGVANTHGVAGFPSGESYKLGASFPYARVQRYFIRQSIDLGGESQKVDADINQFAQSQTANHLVLTLGKFSITDVFDTNKYANNPKVDFLNWSLINAGSFDYAGDAWGYTYGGSAELYEDRYAIRAGIFDLSSTPAGGADNATAYGLDPSFHQFQLVGELEERHTIASHPGKLKLTGFVSIGNAGSFGDALAYAGATGIDASDALAAVRHRQPRPGVSLNLEQELTATIGAFARIGWADGSVEPWDFTDVDRTLSGGLSFNGKPWGRAEDTIGVAGVLNGISAVHAAYFQNGGLGILIGDGALPNVTIEKIFETYYSYSVSPTTKLSFDFQFVGDPAYNPERGPAYLGAVRLHTQF